MTDYRIIAPFIAGLLAATAAVAAPVEQRADPAIAGDHYGDRQQGSFGDMGQGNFGNPAEGYFLTQNYRRDQEGSVPAIPGVPKKFRPPPSPPPLRATTRVETAPYVVIQPPPATAPAKKQPDTAKRRNPPVR